MIRLLPNHASRITRSPQVQFTFSGRDIMGLDGENLATALLRAGILDLRTAPNDGSARGAFCCMGLCQECVVKIDGKTTEACRTTIRAGLEVSRAP